MRAAIYLRVSTDHDEQRLSPEHQLATCREYIADIGMDADDELVYNDAGLSGTEIANRKEVQRLVADARNGKFETVVFTAISRFARDLADALNLKKRLETLYGIRIISVEEGYDTACEGRNSELIFTVHAMVAAHKSQEMSKAIRRGLRQSAASGRHIGSRPPYGYKKSAEKKLFPVVQEAAIVREIFQLYLTGMGAKAIAEELNRRGASPAKARYWQAQTITAILHNPVYKGVQVANKRRTETDIALSRQYDMKIRRQKQRPVADWVVVRDNHEPIIDEATFQAVQSLLAIKAKNKGVKRQSNLLSGLLRCAECGGAAIVHSGKKDRQGRAYKYVGCAAVLRSGKQACRNHTLYNYYEILEAVLQPLQQWEPAPDVMESIVEKMHQTVSARNVTDEISALFLHLEQNEKRQKEALRAFTEGVFNRELVLAHQQELREEAKKIQTEIDRLSTELVTLEQMDAQRTDLQVSLQLFQHYERFHRLVVRSALSVVVAQIELTADRRLRIVWQWNCGPMNRLPTPLMS